jgi:flavin reductase (DIM6/NTAB) family NADH-FMN oxidoreductase RutF
MTDAPSSFATLRRQEFRDYFQPSRVVLCVLPAETESGFNVITLCFSMHCSYKPAMMAIAIQNINVSHALIQRAEEYVLAVPGERLANEAMACGRQSMTNVDKIKTFGLRLVPSQNVSVPGLADAIANVEMVKRASTDSGDHIVVLGEVVRFAVNTNNSQRPLLSIGPDLRGFELLVKEGNDRLGVVAR